jgi:hypothetical protein
MAGGIGSEVLPLLEDVSFAVNERERLRRDDLGRRDSTLQGAGTGMITTIGAGYVVCVMAVVLYVRLGAPVRREML